ncbi:hypothetical protein ZWY2020_029908 [Hordeum vulgare]|nr:hypothetical protein ZWY2020_029908 [Hordeum vulgare]
MPPCHRVRHYPYLMLVFWLERLEHIRARREARITLGIPPDAVGPEDLEEEEMVGEDEEVDAKRHCLQPAKARHDADVDKMLAYMDDDDEEEEPEPSHVRVYLVPGTDVVDIFVDEA